MLRQIIKPLESNYTIQLPNDLLGKTVEIIAFEITEQSGADEINTDMAKKMRLKRIEDLTKDKLVDLSSFKFSRDEANDYSE